MRRAVQQVAQQAFWDVLAEGLDERPPQWERLLTLLEEARSMLLELIPENAEEGKQLRADVLERLNMVCPRTLYISIGRYRVRKRPICVAARV